MATKTHVTVQGDMWDGIAKKTLGNERYMDKLIEANPDHQETVIFSGNVRLTIPDIPTTATQTLPPWKRGGSS